MHVERSCSEARVFRSEYCNGNLSVKFEASVHYCDVPPLVTGHPGRSIFTTEYSRHWRPTSIYVVVQETWVNEVRRRT